MVKRIFNCFALFIITLILYLIVTYIYIKVFSLEYLSTIAVIIKGLVFSLVITVALCSIDKTTNSTKNQKSKN